MRIEWISAHAFGSLTSRTLEFGPGLNVVVGPNESGKSTWQSALYAAICGRRRGPGATEDDKSFERQYRPWLGEQWSVGARILTDSGRRIEVQRDLAANAASVTDVDLGTDLAPELIFDGSPDLSVLLGLNRLLFRTTASVRQAELQLLQDDKTTTAMQRELQRVADTAGGSDTNAANALKLIEAFRQDQVGTTRSNAVKPLRKAMDALTEANARLDAARAAHQEYITLAGAFELADANAAAAKAEATRTADELAALTRAAGRAEAVAGARLRLDSAASELARATERLQLLREQSLRLAQIQRELGEVGDTTVPGELLDLVSRANDLRSRRSGIGDRRPELDDETSIQAAADVGLAELRRMLSEAESLREPDRPDDAALAAAQEAVRLAAGSGGSPGAAPMLRRIAIAGTIASLLGVGLVLAKLTIAGVGAIVVGGALLTFSLWPRPRSQSGDFDARLQVQSALAATQERHRLATDAHRTWAAQREELAERARVRSLPIDPGELRTLVAAVEYREQRRPAQLHWDQLTAQLDGTLDQLRNGLVARGRAVGADPLVAYESYAVECQSNKTRRTQLEAQFTAVVADSDPTLWPSQIAELELGLPNLDQQRVAAAEQLRATETNFGLTGAVPEDEPTTETLTERLATLRATAGEAAQRSVEAAAAAHTLAGQLAERARTLPSVAFAEESAAQAENELARIQRLDDILQTTRTYLSAAQQDHYRDVAPVLVAAVTPRLPAVTGGRYTRASVVPADLRVSVADEYGQLRSAELLSLGTREQIYLLLRLGLTEVLTKGRETCPLILDDVTVHADEVRKLALLELIRTISADRQVVLFSQEIIVRDWAHGELDAGRDRLIELPAPPASRG